MSSGKKIILQHFRKEHSQLNSLEEKIARLETATKQKLKEFSESSKKAKLYADHPYDLSGVKRNLFETQLKHLPLRQPETLFSSPETKPKQQDNPANLSPSPDRNPASRAQTNQELSRLRKENKRLQHYIHDSRTAKLEEQLELLAIVEEMQSALKFHTQRKLAANRRQ